MLILKCRGLNLETDYDKRDLMKIAIDSKVDGIIVEADESAMMTDLIREAEDNGIPVVTVLEDNTQAGRQSYVSISYYNLGREYGNQLCDIIREKQVKGYGSRQNVMVLFGCGTRGYKSEYPSCLYAGGD